MISELASKAISVSSRSNGASRNTRITTHGRPDKTPTIKISLGCCLRKIVGSTISFVPLLLLEILM
jgi:hypothetical protein